MADYPPPPYNESADSTQHGIQNMSFQHQTSVPTTQRIRQPLNDVEKFYRKIGNRLVYDFEKVTCVPGQRSGLDEGVQSQIPTELSEKGITIEQWQEWIVELEEVQTMAPTICGCMLMFCFPGGLVQSLLCACFCPISANHCFKCLPCCYGDWFEGLRQWMDNVNSVLNRHEMHAKLLTYKPYNQAPKSKNYGSRIAGKDHNYEMSFLVIAVTADESLKLQAESWDHGVNDKCTSGNGRIL